MSIFGPWAASLQRWPRTPYFSEATQRSIRDLARDRDEDEPGRAMTQISEYSDLRSLPNHGSPAMPLERHHLDSFGSKPRSVAMAMCRICADLSLLFFSLSLSLCLRLRLRLSQIVWVVVVSSIDQR